MSRRNRPRASQAKKRAQRWARQYISLSIDTERK